MNLQVVNEAGTLVDSIERADVKIFEDGLTQNITDFTVKKKGPVTVAFVIDGSDFQEFHKDITSVCKEMIAKFAPADNAFVVSFVRRNIQIVETVTNDKARLNAAFDTLDIESGPATPVDAVYFTAQKIMAIKKIAPKRKFAIVLLTDGGDDNSYRSMGDLAKFLDKSEIEIFSIGLPFSVSATDPPQEVLRQLRYKRQAENCLRQFGVITGGASWVVDRSSYSKEIKMMADFVSRQIHSQYSVAYSPVNQKNDEHIRKVRVEIVDGPEGKKRKGIIQASIIIPKNDWDGK